MSKGEELAIIMVIGIFTVTAFFIGMYTGMKQMADKVYKGEWKLVANTNTVTSVSWKISN